MWFCSLLYVCVKSVEALCQDMPRKILQQLTAFPAYAEKLKESFPPSPSLVLYPGSEHSVSATDLQIIPSPSLVLYLGSEHSVSYRPPDSPLSILVFFTQDQSTLCWLHYRHPSFLWLSSYNPRFQISIHGLLLLTNNPQEVSSKQPETRLAFWHLWHPNQPPPGTLPTSRPCAPILKHPPRIKPIAHPAGVSCPWYSIPCPIGPHSPASLWFAPYNSGFQTCIRGLWLPTNSSLKAPEEQAGFLAPLILISTLQGPCSDLIM